MYKNLVILQILIILLILSSCGGLRDHIRERQQATRTKDDKGRVVKIEIPDGEDTTVIKKEETKVKVDYPYFKDKWGIKLNGNENLKLLQSIDEWLGVSYKNGGTTKSGIDCSGLVKVIYKKVYNVDLARSSHDIYLQSVEITRSKLSEGDLIFFKEKDKEISHVGIYISNGNFIHASSSAGVIISNLDEKYFAERFYKAGRMKK